MKLKTGKSVKDLTREELENSYQKAHERATTLQLILDRILLNISSVTESSLMKKYHYQLKLEHNPNYDFDLGVEFPSK